MVDLNEKTLEVMDRNQDTQEPRFRDVIAIFKLLSSQLTEARELLEVGSCRLCTFDLSVED